MQQKILVSSSFSEQFIDMRSRFSALSTAVSTSGRPNGKTSRTLLTLVLVIVGQRKSGFQMAFESTTFQRMVDGLTLSSREARGGLSDLLMSRFIMSRSSCVEKRKDFKLGRRANKIHHRNSAVASVAQRETFDACHRWNKRLSRKRGAPSSKTNQMNILGSHISEFT